MKGCSQHVPKPENNKKVRLCFSSELTRIRGKTKCDSDGSGECCSPIHSTLPWSRRFRHSHELCGIRKVCSIRCVLSLERSGDSVFLLLTLPILLLTVPVRSPAGGAPIWGHFKCLGDSYVLLFKHCRTSNAAYRCNSPFDVFCDRQESLWPADQMTPITLKHATEVIAYDIH